MVVPLGTTTALLVAMATKHLLADFFLQSAAIAKGKAAERGWLVPLFLHAGAHALITLAIALIFYPTAWWIAPAEFVVHAGIDRGKVKVGKRAQLDVAQPAFWWLFGLDQYLHQLTNIAIVFVFLAPALVS